MKVITAFQSHSVYTDEHVTGMLCKRKINNQKLCE